MHMTLDHEDPVQKRDGTPVKVAPGHEAWLRAVVDGNHPASLAHGREHVNRVVSTCKFLARAVVAGEGGSVDWEIMLAAAYLHDTGRLPSLVQLPGVAPPATDSHARRGAILARELLARSGWFPAEKIPAVEAAILAHSYSGGTPPASIEARILSDADKLDAMGAMGVVRTVAHSLEHGRSLDDTIEHLESKIARLDEHLSTGPAIAAAAGKAALVQRFLADLRRSLDPASEQDELQV